jgi:hypothetical protein
MLRPTPQPPDEICLSIDVGSQNCGVCLFDGKPTAQNILYLAKTQLLDEHAYVVHDPAEVKGHLDRIVHQVETLLNGRPYYCLIEMQYFDKEASRGLVFPLQLESCIGMYFVQKGIPVRIIHATKRYPFLNIQNWKQDTRWRRKQRVVEVVSNILNPAVPGNGFAHRNHDLSAWNSLPAAQRHDVADAIAQCLVFHYRNLQAVYEGRPSSPVETANTPTTSQQAIHPPLQQTTASRGRQQAPSLAEMRGKLERTLAQLKIDYYDLLKGEASNTARLFKVYRQHPDNKHLRAFLAALNSFNNTETDVLNLETLEARLTPLLT